MHFKKLFATTVLATAMGVAHAQAPVTVYGVVDVNMGSTRTSNSGSDTVQGDNSLLTSRLGFRGSEDLGGGLKAEFQLESRLNPPSGVAGGGTATTANSQFFNREAWVGLSSTKFGSFRMGTTDVTNAANIDFLVSTAGNFGLATTQHGVDRPRVVRYATPAYRGVAVEVGYASPDSTATSEITSNSVQSGLLRYDQGKIGLYAGVERKKIDGNYTQDHTILGAKYDFGFARVGAYHGIKDGATLVTANTGETKQTRISVAVPLKNNYTVHGMYLKDSTSQVASTDYTGYRAILTKDMSKRTALYTAYTKFDNAGSTADRTTFIAGVNHRF
jgi:general bacterial porin, GBP family